MGSAPLQLEWFPKPTAKFPERYSRVAASGAVQVPAQEALSPHFPRQWRVLTLASGPFLSSVGKDAVKDIGGSGKNRRPSGNHPKGSRHSCVACPAPATPALAFSRASVLERTRPSSGALQEAEVSTFQGLAFPPHSSRKAWASSWELAVDRMWGPASSLPGKALRAP